MKLRIREITQQLEFVAIESLPIILFCVSFAAMVTILESSFHMKIVIQNDSLVPGFAALLIIRELAAVVSGLLLTSRVGAGMTAEIGTMKITEQLEALKLLGIRAGNYLVWPRFIACVLGLSILTILANVVCIICAIFVSQAYLDFTPQMFLSAMNRFVDFQDLVFSVVKGAVFGAIIPLVSVFYGFRCQSGAEGVGNATTNSVVTASIGIIVFDFILSYVFSFFY